jgi:carbon starvation protein
LLRDAIDAGKLPAAIKTLDDARRMLVNDYVDAIVTGFFMLSVVVILVDSIRVWFAFDPRRGSAESAVGQPAPQPG